MTGVKLVDSDAYKEEEVEFEGGPKINEFDNELIEEVEETTKIDKEEVIIMPSSYGDEDSRHIIYEKAIGGSSAPLYLLRDEEGISKDNIVIRLLKKSINVIEKDIIKGLAGSDGGQYAVYMITYNGEIRLIGSIDEEKLSNRRTMYAISALKQCIQVYKNVKSDDNMDDLSGKLMTIEDCRLVWYG